MLRVFAFFNLLLALSFNLDGKSHSPYFLVILVDAPHLDYSSNPRLLQTLAKHPSNGSKRGDVGHAWIYIQGIVNGTPIFIEGGHSGERSFSQPPYVEGVMNCIEYGVANPRMESPKGFGMEPNPLRYLWEERDDGYFEEGSGGHKPTFAARIDLSEEDFLRILRFIDFDCYDYSNYSLTGNQCTTFVVQVAAIAGWFLDCGTVIEIEPVLKIGKKNYILWTDPLYRTLSFSSPDQLEKSLKMSVLNGESKNALNWYQHRKPETFLAWCYRSLDAVFRFPVRLTRWLSLQ